MRPARDEAADRGQYRQAAGVGGQNQRLAMPDDIEKISKRINELGTKSGQILLFSQFRDGDGLSRRH
jgi:hypothetical protein